jgi:hypothetical protein
MTFMEWSCPNCNRVVSSAYCPECGERPLRPRDLTCRALFDQVVEASTNIDGKLMRSLRCLVLRPGALTVAYLQGRRKVYTTPLQLFLLANVLFFALQSLTGSKVFSTTLESHLHVQDWAPTAQRLVDARLKAMHRTADVYAPVFDQAVALNAKSLIILMVVPFTLILPIAFYRYHRPFLVHVVFALHFYAFLLLLFCAALVVVAVNLRSGGNGLISPRIDRTLSIIQLIACGTYLYFAVGTMYGSHGIGRILRVIPLTAAVAVIVLGYRFALLLITLYTT